MNYIPNYVDSWGGIIEILGIFSDRVWNKEIFSDALENSKDSNVPFDVKTYFVEGIKMSCLSIRRPLDLEKDYKTLKKSTVSNISKL